MADRASALKGHYQAGHFGVADTGVTLTEITDLSLYQIAAWPETLADVAQQAATLAGCDSAPAPLCAVEGSNGSLLRTEPLKWWLVDAIATDFDPIKGASLDLSHSRTHVRITGSESATLLNRHLPLDLREDAFGVDSVASTAFHHCGVTLWHSSQGYELFLPRGFALSLWELLRESAEQFGVEVV